MVRIHVQLSFLFIITGVCLATELYYDRIELLNATYVEDIYNVSQFRINKFNRTTYVLNLDVELFNDAGEDYTVSIDFYYNRLNNNQYSKSPIRVAKTSVCRAVDRYYPLLVVGSSKNYTNFQDIKTGATCCPLKKVIKLVFLS